MVNLYSFAKETTEKTEIKGACTKPSAKKAKALSSYYFYSGMKKDLSSNKGKRDKIKKKQNKTNDNIISYDSYCKF